MEQKVGEKRWRSWLLLLLNLAVVGGIFLHEFGGASSKTIALEAFYLPPLLAAAGCFGVMLAAETFKYAHLLRVAHQPSPWRTGLACAVLGKYFDNLTPAGAGGQPFQMAYLKKRGCPDGVSGALPVLGFLGLQFSFVVIALGCFILGRPVLEADRALRLTSYLGLCAYSIVPACVLLFSAMPRALERFLRWGTGCLGRIRVVRDAEAAAEKALSALDSYRGSLRFFKDQPGVLAAVAASSLLFRFAMLAMPYFVLHAFGAVVGFWPCFCRVAAIYAAITLIPTPGNAGAAEASFYTVFAALSPGTAFWAMLAWRLLCYYSWLAGGAAYCLGQAFRSAKAPPEKDSPAARGAAYFVDAYFPHVDGVVRTVHAYAGRMAGSCVLCPTGGKNADASLPYDVLRVPSIPCPGLGYAIPLPGLSRRARRFLAENRLTVFHAHSPFTMGHFALRMGRRLGVPVVATFHSKYYDDVLAAYRSKWLAEAVTRYIVRFYRRVDEVWACSASTAQTLRSYGYEGEIRVMENGTEPVAAAPAEAAWAAQCFRLAPDCPSLLFVGQQIWQKNLRLVLDTCGELKSRGFRFRMLVAGCGGDAAPIRAYAEAKGLTDVVSFVGFISDQALLRGLYMASSLLFFPSVYDNAPLVVREAAALGVPSLLAKGSNAAECIRDGENGFEAACSPVEMADKIIEIFDGNAAKEAGLNAKKTIPIPWELIIDRACAAYGELTGRVKACAE